MAAKRKRAVLTENFAKNLKSIEHFLGAEGASAFRRFLNHFFQSVVPSLVRFPQAGRAFFRHPIRSLEGARLLKRLKKLLEPNEEIREFIVGDYLFLYLLGKDLIIFLSVKHHRQLSYNLSEFWWSEGR